VEIKPLIQKCLAVGIILLFIGTGLIPAIAQNIEKPLSVSRGKWLYVGGGGPGNYSKIQDAIDYSSNGDTVFVYAASSPYHEYITINKSIHLIGEDRTTTIIDGEKNIDFVWIQTSFVNLSGFTITNCSANGFGAGITIEHKDSYIKLTNIDISNCIIKNNEEGIRAVNIDFLNISFCRIHNNPSSCIYLSPSFHVHIFNCEITHNGKNLNNSSIVPGGIFITGDSAHGGMSKDIIISNCSIANNIGCGILVASSSNIEICHNTIFDNPRMGIWVLGGHVKIYNNHIFNNSINGPIYEGSIYLLKCFNSVSVYENIIETNYQCGILLSGSSGNSVNKNNFINNKYNAFFSLSILNNWGGNYWTDWLGFGPKVIKGMGLFFLITWVNFDWHPAREPYTIGI
jgi:parallel beta-helix repeat protein